MAFPEVHEREKRWQSAWAEAKLFEAEPKHGQKKFFCTFPYPYVNGLPHVGHLFTMMRVEAFARYKRATGHNVLFPQAWHATGSPIATAAMRVTEGDEKQIKILKENGVAENEIPLFKEAEHWIRYFAPRYKRDVTAAGLSIDWRREFITTSLNPQYDAFIKWQFLTLKDKGYVQKGRHPVVWCPKESAPVSDHARSVGEGETPQEFTLLKFPLVDEPGTFVIAATLRPETVYGQTNLWVGKDIVYEKVVVDGEQWIISSPCIEKLSMQEHKVKQVGTVLGKNLLGRLVRAPMVQHEIPILPSHFCNPEKGTGIVTSVPSDAPDDWIGLHDLQQPGAAEKEGIAHNIVAGIVPIPIIRSSDLGDVAAVTICEQMGIKNQHERSKLEEAKKIVYKKGFYEGVLIVGPYAGMPVQQAKDKVKKELLDRKEATLFYELTGKVVCRCQTPSVVKIVSDQWFITYGNEEWKKQAHLALNKLVLYPEKSRQQFDYVIDWLNDWACTREFGIGTRLPWDDQWLIESLSDSTIYMAYYTIAHHLKDIPANYLTREFFDYVYLGKGTAPSVPNVDVKALHDEFRYWYPVDFRNSGKDLIQNHLTFFLFNHSAIFPPEQWPAGIGVNGWVMVNGQKMSKSLGNVIPLRQLVEEFGADATRMTILNGGEGMDDPNWDSSFAKALSGKLDGLLRMAHDLKEAHPQHTPPHNSHAHDAAPTTPIDNWLRSITHKIIRLVTEAMDLTNFRTAIQLAFFEFGQQMKWYLARTAGAPSKRLLRTAFEAQLIMLSPFIPHVCEEAWSILGNKGFVSAAHWPQHDVAFIDTSLDDAERMVRAVADDIQRLLEKTPAPQEVTLYLAADWKRDAYVAVDALLEKTRNPGEIIKHITDASLKNQGAELMRLVTYLIKSGRTPQVVPSADTEREVLSSAVPYFSSIASGAKIVIADAGSADNAKANTGLPGKPSVHLS